MWLETKLLNSAGGPGSAIMFVNNAVSSINSANSCFASWYVIDFSSHFSLASKTFLPSSIACIFSAVISSSYST